ncbi:hypothetical protein SO802_010146 [Lithocarpus litseifolius]|uniref:Protein kinase domain-containing protein n=1 Tax=Lithocarpus litseifolius TaxID=425828 RepID=A0AAW2DEV7_9ROSI
MALQLVIPINFLLLLSSGLAEAAPIAKPGCTSVCKNVRIPYPFGIQSGCYMDPWFEIVCNGTGAFLKKINMEVLEIALDGRSSSAEKVRVKGGSIISSNPNCTSMRSGVMNLKGSPFTFSYNNYFVSFGCNVTATIADTDQQVVGCKSLCNTSLINGARNSSSGFNHCIGLIPDGLQVFNVEFASTDNKVLGGCNYAYLSESSRPEIKSINTMEKLGFAPVLLDWQIYNWTNGWRVMLDSFNNRRDFRCYISYSTSSSIYYYSDFDAKSFHNTISKHYDEISSLICNCAWGYEGNPYLSAGCEDINECEDPKLNHCPNKWDCQNAKGGYSCNKKKMIIIGFGASLGGLSLVVSIWWLYKVIKRRSEIKLKKKFFKRNGGLLLQQQLSSSEHNVQNTKLFSSKELDTATDQFNESRILGKGGQGTVYKGMLTDGRIVAIKKCNIVDEGNLEQFINEIIILSQINHRNVVKLLGCCLETEVPLLVYEFIPNGTLSQYLHEEIEEFPLTWNMRLRIAIEVAGALSYLHSAASLPIYHRDIKSTNILLDDKYRAKVADFGTSRTVAIDQTHLTTLVYGTFGYLDPEYFQTSQFTEKSDVYSFGVVLVELLTREKPVSLVRTQERRSLATYFILSMEEGFLFDILDAGVKNEGDIQEIMVVADLAKRCLELNGKRRPTMREVTKELEGVRKTFNGQENCETI